MIRIPIFPRQDVFETKNALPLYKTKEIKRLYIALTDLESNSKFVNISVIYLIYKEIYHSLHFPFDTFLALVSKNL